MAFTLLTLVAFVLSVSLGVYVLAKNPSSDVGRLFAVLCALLGLWYIGTSFQLVSATARHARTWYLVATAGWFLVGPVFLTFILALTENEHVRRRRWLVLLLYIPAPVFTYKNFTSSVFARGFVSTPLGWSYIQALTPWFGFALLYAMITITAGFVLLLRRNAREVDRAHKTQTTIIAVSLGAGMVLYMVMASLSLALDLSPLSNISTVSSLVWQAGIAWAVVRHGLLVVSPADAAYEIFATMADGVLLVDSGGRIADANPAARVLLGAGALPAMSRLEEAVPGIFGGARLQDMLESGAAVRDFETRLTRGSRETSLSISVAPLSERSEKGRRSRRVSSLRGAVIVLRDITERKLAERQLHHLATHDVLTNLPNRVLLNDRLKNAQARAQRYQQMVAVLFIDLDRFKEINDRYGHDVGDLLLKEVARRLVSSVREYDTVSRLGGDEFVVVLTDFGDVKSCTTIIERMQAALSRPVRHEKGELLVGTSIGVSLYPLHADNTEDLYRLADMALYRVKSTGRNGYRVYSPEDEAVTRRAAVLEKDLQKAISGGELKLYYQPIYDLASTQLTAMEALLRWNHPELGLIKPMDFIPLAERSGAIVELGEWVLRRACEQLAEWKAQGREIRVAINVSARQFGDPLLLEKILGVLKEHDLRPDMIELEFTESTAMVDVNLTVAMAERLRVCGIGIIIDDFGSGFSSMAWLKHLNARAIKIDRFFMQNIAHDVNDVAIVKAIVAMAHSMGMQVIAEGIESEQQLTAIRGMRWEHQTDFACDFVQGYLFSEPVPARKAGELLDRRP